jgi:hypothetical protein
MLCSRSLSCWRRLKKLSTVTIRLLDVPVPSLVRCYQSTTTNENNPPLSALQREGERRRLDTQILQLQKMLEGNQQTTRWTRPEQETEYQRLRQKLQEIQSWQSSTMLKSTVTTSAKQMQELSQAQQEIQQLETKQHELQQWMHLTRTEVAERIQALQTEIDQLQTLRETRYGTLNNKKDKQLLSTLQHYQSLVQTYGLPFIVWYWSLWSASCAGVYVAIDLCGIDAMELLTHVHERTGFDVASHIEPEWGNLGLAVAVNELLEPIRLPLVLFTVKPVMDTVRPLKKRLN